MQLWITIVSHHTPHTWCVIPKLPVTPAQLWGPVLAEMHPVHLGDCLTSRAKDHLQLGELWLLIYSWNRDMHMPVCNKTPSSSSPCYPHAPRWSSCGRCCSELCSSFPLRWRSPSRSWWRCCWILDSRSSEIVNHKCTMIWSVYTYALAVSYFRIPCFYLHLSFGPKLILI